METTKNKIITLWLVLTGGYALHSQADLMPLFWAEDIAIDTSGSAPAGLLTFMMIVSYLIPVCGILFTLYGNCRVWRIANCALSALILLFNVFHLSELFMEFNPVQLPLLPVILCVSGFLFRESWKQVKTDKLNR